MVRYTGLIVGVLVVTSTAGAGAAAVRQLPPVDSSRRDSVWRLTTFVSRGIERRAKRPYFTRSSVSRRVSVSLPALIDPTAGPKSSVPFSKRKNRFCSVPT